MGSLNRLFDFAAKALDSSGSQASSGPQTSGNGRDSRAMVRDVGGAVTGEPRSAAPPAAPGSWTPPATDRAAIARYEYLLQTSDPHQVEAIHRRAVGWRRAPRSSVPADCWVRSRVPPW
ncbi:hypothetical protein [Microbacterium sp. LWS13-1.2]|uniref:Uncharacterized protein n=1 Tax=Microbacterium sp. LWS13-1.2 TaxID=3135264 RepID=A0AAU6SEZ7_9MICO